MISQVPTKVLPKGSYNGITLILSHASRFDTKGLFTGLCGDWFHYRCLLPETNIWNCELRTLACTDSLHKDTKVVIIFGSEAGSILLDKHNLDNIRGIPQVYQGLHAICTYAPQDAYDFTNIEGEEEDFGIPEKDSTPTSKLNYMFWVEQDVKKLFRIVQEGLHQVPLFDTRINPPLTFATEALSQKNSTLYLDIETHASDTLLCIGFAFDMGPVWVVPIYNPNGNLYSENFPRFFAALAIAMRDNTVVCHNAMFDLFWLTHFMHIPFGRKTYDSMLAQHRIYPTAEKSLAHCISLWTDEQSHKDQGNFDPKNRAQEITLWGYNALDVHVMRLIKCNQELYCKKDQGLRDSISQVNASIPVYLTLQLQGILYSPEKLHATLAYNERLLIQYQRCIDILCGYHVLATSTKDVPKYLYERLKYKVLARTEGGFPSCGRKTLLRLRLQHDNPVLNFILLYRKAKKENGMLKFNPI